MTTTTTPKAGPPASTAPADDGAPVDFIRQIVADDLAAGRHRRIVTRFPPEPNGYLHIGHAKSICLNFGIARENAGGRCNLRFDDTNPTTEDVEYVEAIEDNVRWLGFDWDGLYFASDYFEQFYGWAVELIETGKAYVDHLSEDEIRAFRGTVTEPGRESPYRTRSVAENLDLFTRMRAGEFPDGACVLRAKIDMASANMKMRDPLLYRIRHAHHYRTGDDWPIYPMYDWAHPLSDAIEGITHSLCTLEFENNRELYDWVVGNTSVPSRPRQIEFARLNLTHTVMSKRKFLQLVERRLVAGWDDPRMPTLAGLRRRGYTPEAIRTFCDRIGVAKSNSTVDVAQLEHAVREDLNQRAPRVLAVLRPLKVVIDNYPEGEVEDLEAPSWPADVPREGARRLPFSRELLIERDDFREDPPKGFYRLSPGAEVRLRYAYLVRCVGVVRDEASGEPVEVHCTYDPATRGGAAPDGRRVRGTIHWLSAAHAVPVEVRLYDRLFRLERPDLAENAGLEELINPDSIEVVRDAWIEPAAASAEAGSHVQFERHGYFFADPVDSRPGAPVFNRVVALRDSWAKLEAGKDEAGSAGDEKPVRRGPAAVSARPAAGAAPEPPRPVLDDPRALRFRDELGLAEADAALLAADPRLAALFEEAVALHPNPRGIANWIVNELLRELKGREDEGPPVSAAGLAELVAMIDAGAVSTTAAKEVFAEVVAGGGGPRRIVAERGLEQVADREVLVPLVDEVLVGHPAEVAAYRAGKGSLAGFFVGRVMKSSGGRADPRLVAELVRERLTLAGGN